ncbi:uncharacterized protein EI90DRAFT_3285311 [Cantharellus anzutake]|uniref:uncharacterized protein n=1 Tax=Cantharellus anzutake TaxID=1750568 RepID=UPI00190428A7|nr:uncharacterized protein EI90DRAFT_3285311 [Cantharellus anzutake]KAF8342218.1 hypothetical protein EI90DRAFT_3285311 [Cantharellus anzutake]
MEQQGFPVVEEVVLQIFSWLDACDLCRVQAVNKFFCRLSSDNHLWKILFFEKHPSRRLRGGRGILYPSLGPDGEDHNGRAIKKLPRRAGLTLRQAHRQNWKTLYRIAWNWEQGRCTKLHVQGNQTHDQDNLVRAAALSGPLTSIAIRNRVVAHFAANDPSVSGLLPGLGDPDERSLVTSIALDQSPNAPPDVLRLAYFHEVGVFSVCEISTTFLPHVPEQGPEHGLSRKLYHLGAHSSEGFAPRLRQSNIVSSAYHHPLLVALSEAFHILVYYLPTVVSPPSDGGFQSSPPLRPILQHSLHSYTSFPPSSMSLTRTYKSTFKLVVAYSVPVFPAHFTAGACEISISLNEQALPPGSSSSGTFARVTSTRMASANTPFGWFEAPTSPSSCQDPESEPKVSTLRHQAELAMEQWDRKVGKVAGVQTDGKWVVLGSEDGVLQVYRLYRPPSTSSNATPMSLTYQHNLYGHTAGISGLKVTDGRCVSLGKEGVVRVWDLEEGWAVEVGGASWADEDGEGKGDTGGRAVAEGRPVVVTFDERRIVATDTRRGGVNIWRFDT